jgi:cbb3-type cytochrome oxidase cytochrome c subunit
MRLDFHKNHRLLYGVALFGFIALTLIIAIGPAIWVNDHNAPLPTSQPLTAEERAGLGVYVGEGCLYCHTQQVRPLPQDQPYGRPAVPGDYARLHWLDVWRAPAMVLGTERTGPDLSNVAARQPSATWQYLHLYQPRSVVPGSVMPAFPWLFTVEANPAPDAVVVPVPPPYAPAAGKVVATARGRALVAYLLALKQAPLVAAGEWRERLRHQVRELSSGERAGDARRLPAAGGRPGGERRGPHGAHPHGAVRAARQGDSRRRVCRGDAAMGRAALRRGDRGRRQSRADELGQPRAHGDRGPGRGGAEGGRRARGRRA